MTVLLRAAMSLLLLTGAVCAQEAAPDDLELLDNGVLRVGLSRAHGGAIAYLSLAGEDDNLINVRALGRYVQQSYYSGPKPFLPDGARMHDGWPGWGWMNAMKARASAVAACWCMPNPNRPELRIGRHG